MRVLVTGAAGFVGYAVAALLIEHGHHVIGLTRSPASALPTGVQRLHGDLNTPGTLPAALAEVDGVCHLAGLTKVRQSRSHPVGYWRTNVGGTLTILARLTSARIGRLVVASTCVIYEQAEQPISETAARAPSSPYATSKLAADQAAADLARLQRRQWPCAARSDTPPRRTSPTPLAKGDRVLVTGVLRQRGWDTTNGDQRYAYHVEATEVGASLTRATVTITKTTHDTTAPAQTAGATTSPRRDPAPDRLARRCRPPMTAAGRGTHRPPAATPPPSNPVQLQPVQRRRPARSDGRSRTSSVAPVPPDLVRDGCDGTGSTPPLPAENPPKRRLGSGHREPSQPSQAPGTDPVR